MANRALIKVIGDAGLKARREGEKAGDEARQRQKQRLLSVSIPANYCRTKKIERIRKLLAEHKQVGMIGDGVNDAPAIDLVAKIWRRK